MELLSSYYMLSLLGENHRLPLFHMSKRFILLNETKQRIKQFTIGYMINPGLNVKKSFREQVEKCMFTPFGEITQLFIKATLSKNNTSVLALIMFYDTRVDHPKKAYRLFICVVYTIIKNYVCIYYLAGQLEQLSEIPVGYVGVSKHRDKSFDRILVIGIPDLLIKLMSCRGFLKNLNYAVILKFPKMMLEYYFSI